MKRIFWIFLVILFGIILPSFSFAQNTNDTWYNLTNFVTDTTNILSVEQLTQLNAQAQTIKEATSNEIATLLIPNRNGKELYDIALEVFRTNGIGTEKNNNWVLLIISTEEKKLRIMVGYGLEWALPDVLANQIIENELRPLLNSWLIYETVQTYISTVSKAIEWEYVLDPAFQNPGNENEFLIGFMIGFFLLARLVRLYVPRSSTSVEISSKKTLSGLWVLFILFIVSIALGLLLWYFGLLIWSIVGGIINLPRSKNNPIWDWFGGFGWWFGWSSGWGWGWWGFGWFGWGSSGGGGAGD